MKYAQETGLSHARKRRQRRSITILIIVAVLVGGGFGYAVAYTAGLVPGSALPTVPASCKVTPTKSPQAAAVLNVYNAAKAQGRAGETGRALSSRGFQVGVVSNDPYKMKLTGFGQIRFGPKGAAFAKQYVQPLASQATLMQDGRDDTSVDLVLGDQFAPIPSMSPTPSPTIPGC
ncbi:LytR C-terminal domain-containing protein [Calidifontibacter sp. DB0510]|uniref:LytR C-terminal domain-containing protein n=1 Tax=Metallococcus carri TaxID=1656884 RepID=A0A967B0Y1_9MICO|nr:LytR C-terminal domain-containing protein [Metallococcus carri]NHN56774.1 LytR C-terminal domain-containing protein [Metallococcus carri]NOP37849.1 LytR C-terminal domain-containing protein [Calidifontibacter sp. DB2511S]